MEAGSPSLNLVPSLDGDDDDDDNDDLARNGVPVVVRNARKPSAPQFEPIISLFPASTQASTYWEEMTRNDGRTTDDDDAKLAQLRVPIPLRPHYVVETKPASDAVEGNEGPYGQNPCTGRMEIEDDDVVFVGTHDSQALVHVS